MANPSPYYTNIQWPGSGGLRVPAEAAGFKATSTQSEVTLDTYGELDLGSQSGTYKLNAQQAAASLITVNATGALTIVYPTCKPGFAAFIQETGGANNVTVEINGNSSNTVTITEGKMGCIVHTATNGGVYAATAGN